MYFFFFFFFFFCVHCLSQGNISFCSLFNPCPAEPGYTLPLQTAVDPDQLASEEAN